MRRPFRELCLALFGLLLTSTVALAQLVDSAIERPGDG
jgi:hypothetical protein